MRNPKQNQTQNDFLPEAYEIPKGESNYMKFDKGENKFRILSKPIIGWEDWKDKKPLRFFMSEKPEKAINPNQPIKHFWAMIVWNYTLNKIQILEITQKTIQGAIEQFAKDEDWGSPYGYDIKVIKTGDGMDTEYSVTPSPHKPVTDEMTTAYSAKPCYLQALYQGLDPFENHGEVTPKNDLQL